MRPWSAPFALLPILRTAFARAAVRVFGAAIAPLALVLFVGNALFAASPAHATVVSVPSLEEMAVASEVVAEVSVVDQHSVRDEQRRIVTTTTLQVLDAWKGTKAGARLTLWQLGGDVDGKNAWIVGATKFKKGDHFVFFGVHHVSGPADEVVCYGIGFGTFAVVPDPTGARRDPVVVENVGDVVEIKSGSEHAPAIRQYDSLPAFKALVMRAFALQDGPHLRAHADKLGPQLTHPSSSSSSSPSLNVGGAQ